MGTWTEGSESVLRGNKPLWVGDEGWDKSSVDRETRQAPREGVTMSASHWQTILQMTTWKTLCYPAPLSEQSQRQKVRKGAWPAYSWS